MSQVHLHPLDAEPPQAALQLPPDALRREPRILAAVHRAEDLRREDELVADAARAAPVADPGLAAPAAVRVRGVERADACRPRGVHDRERVLAGVALAEQVGCRADAAEVAASEDHARDVDPGRAELPRLHDCEFYRARCRRSLERRSSQRPPTSTIHCIASPSGSGVTT